jgi:hypothetical protein
VLFWSFSTAQGQNLHVFVNVWDGTEKTVLDKIYNQGKLPFLSSVGAIYNLTCNEDCFEDNCMRTVTKPQHATMLTGCLADVHGIYSNSKYQLIPDETTVYELIEAADPSYKTAHIAGKPANVGEPTFGNIVEDIDFFNADATNPSVGTDIAINLISQWKDDNFFIFCHFRQPDNIGHKYGKNTQEYRDAIKRNDKELGRILAALYANGADAQTIIYVLSDHGFGCPRPKQHMCSPNTFIVSNDANLTGDIFMKDVARFLLSYFGLSPVCQ